MLLKDFYTIKSFESTDGQKYVATIMLNKDHDVFKGHFPGNPVTPGVCMMQIIKELTQQAVNTPLIMISASNIKFMALINPEINPLLRLELDIVTADDATIKVKNTSYFDETVALKLSCIYRKN
ncbi:MULTISPECIES: 3-hydroxyacyl-ACP dehydratase [Flavobacterium]|uniref:3-hydroxyacyl-ACP dehydratase n=1 Tax=Flavobacterium suzhouense TaxID=1529638 RepID=A0ABW5NT42_9FLAO|nr:3-hydroxyacyl-ACP dehydratase [Flavobacterium sp. AG291]RDI06752.1 3-hydroxyacyl-[acyl-carrier-protein] dehydratase [Flavobacterium sp. AG291]